MFPASRCIQNQLQRLPKLQPNPLLNLPDRLAQSISTASRRQIADATQATPFPTVSVVTTVSGVSGQGQSQLPDRTRQVVLDMVCFQLASVAQPTLLVLLLLLLIFHQSKQSETAFVKQAPADTSSRCLRQLAVRGYRGSCQPAERQEQSRSDRDATSNTLVFYGELAALTRVAGALEVLEAHKQHLFLVCAWLHGCKQVTRWRLQLDWLVEHFAARPLHRLEDSVLQILRLGEEWSTLLCQRVHDAALTL